MNAAKDGSIWARSSLMRVYRFGVLGQAVDSAKAEVYEKEHLDLLKAQVAEAKATKES